MVLKPYFKHNLFFCPESLINKGSQGSIFLSDNVGQIETPKIACAIMHDPAKKSLECQVHGK